MWVQPEHGYYTYTSSRCYGKTPKISQRHKLFRFGARIRNAAARVVKKTAELLYIVRSNMAHGEKTKYGPDIDKRKRGVSVCQFLLSPHFNFYY